MKGRSVLGKTGKNLTGPGRVEKLEKYEIGPKETGQPCPRPGRTWHGQKNRTGSGR